MYDSINKRFLCTPSPKTKVFNRFFYRSINNNVLAKKFKKKKQKKKNDEKTELY